LYSQLSRMTLAEIKVKMETKKINLFIVDDNELLVTALKLYLTEKFENALIISTFHSGRECLSKITETTDVIILDYFLEDGSDGLKILKAIKQINPLTQVIMLSSNQDIELAIDAFRLGAKDYVVKGSGSWQTVRKLVGNIIKSPIRILVKEFGVSKFMAAFLVTFLAMSIVVLFAIYFIN